MAWVPKLAAALLLLPGLVPLAALPAQAEGPVVTDHVIEGAEGTPIAITVFQPAGATRMDPVPVVVRSHGWSGSRDREPVGIVGALLAQGYGVVTFDARGHGDSGGQARVHAWDHEIEDVRALLDWIHDHLAWVQREATPRVAKDIRVGGSGGSYGGGWQLLTAAKDPRMDVLMPEITWNSLPQSLQPNGAVKSAWVQLLFTAGVARVDMHPDIYQWYAEGMATNRFPEAALASFRQSSPAAHMQDIRVPTLLIQGVPDTLFNLNQALANFHGIRANGAQVKLFTHQDGHLLNAADIQGGAPPVGLQPPGAGSPCGSVEEEALAWYDRHLKGLRVRTGEPLELAFDDGTCWRGAGLGEVADPVTVSGGLTVVAAPVLVPLGLDEGARIAGVPRLHFTYWNSCMPWTLYASLVAVGPEGARTLGAQVTPSRGPSLNDPCPLALTLGRSVAMGGVASALRPGEQAFLKLEPVADQFAANAERFPQRIVLEDFSVEVPVAV